MPPALNGADLVSGWQFQLRLVQIATGEVSGWRVETVEYGPFPVITVRRRIHRRDHNQSLLPKKPRWLSMYPFSNTHAL